MGSVRSELARLWASRGPAKRRVAALIAVFLALFILALAPTGGAAQRASGEHSAATQKLFEAVLDHDLEAVKAALAEGADTRARDSQGRMPAGLAVDKGYFEIAHYILGARKTQRDKERQAAAPPPQPPAPEDTQQARAEGTESGWAVKKTEIAEQPGDGFGGTEIAQTESAERPGQRDDGSTAGRAEIAERADDGAGAPKAEPAEASKIAEPAGDSAGAAKIGPAGRTEVAERAGDATGAPKAEPAEATEIAERAGDGTGAPKAGPAEVAAPASGDESGWKVKNVEIAEEAGAGGTRETAETTAPPPSSVVVAEAPTPLAAGLEPPERGLTGPQGGLTPPAQALGDSGTAPEAPAPSLAAPQETARAESPAVSAVGAVTDSGPDEPLAFSNLLRSFGELIGVVKPRPAQRQTVASRAPAGRATATGTAGAPEPAPRVPASAATSEQVATAIAPDKPASAPGAPEGDGDAGASTATAVPTDASLPGLAPTEQPAAAPEASSSAPPPSATTTDSATALALDRTAPAPGVSEGDGSGRATTETAALPESVVRGLAPAPGSTPGGEPPASPEPGRASAGETDIPALSEDTARTAAVALAPPATPEEPGAVTRLMQNLTKLFQGDEATPAQPETGFQEEKARPVETAEAPQEALPEGSAPQPGQTAVGAPSGEAVARPQPLPSATSEATEQALAGELAEPRPRTPAPGRDAAPTSAEPAGRTLAEVAPAEPEDPSTVISLLEDLAEFFGIRAPRPARPEGPALAEARESAEPSGRAARPSSTEPPPAIIETADALRPTPEGESAIAGEEEQPRPETAPAPETAVPGDRQLATDPGEDAAEADLAQLTEEPGLAEEAQPLDEATAPTASEEADFVDESADPEEADEADAAEEGGLAEDEEEPEGPETPGTPENLAQEGDLEAITDEQEVEKLTAAKPPAEGTEEATDKKDEKESGWAVKNVVIANLPPGSPGAARRPLPPDSYLGGVVLALGESIRLGIERQRHEEKQTAAADTVQTDATEDTAETPADEDGESAEEEAVAEPEPEDESEGDPKDGEDDTWATDDDDDDWGDEDEEDQTAAAEPAKIRCVEKNQGITVFCVEPVDWPEELVGQFDVTSSTPPVASCTRVRNPSSVTITARPRTYRLSS